MNGDVEEEASRPRPLSGGIWTLFSWLRRSERSSSSESISSVGSDRTAASFDFLSPIHYRHSAPPLILQPNSPSDTYKKRVHERNLRRQRERDITLHRKYGLWREDSGYNAFSLPPAHRKSQEFSDKQSRCRRAASECLQRRAAYVPGKRRAPLPPNITSMSLPRNYKRKRPAPKPPVHLAIANKENLEINNNKLRMQPTVTDNSITSTLSRSDTSKEIKEIKRPEKSFIKQIFENRKRNSAIEISHVKLLPSISELDKQAAEIIETNRMLQNFKSNVIDNNEIVIQQKMLPSGNMWMCTKCLRKYNTSIKSCVYCVPRENILNDFASTASNMYTQTDSKESKVKIKLSNDVNQDAEKKKLKEMLKEMKDSLPKKSKEGKICTNLKIMERNHSTEAPTLRIGCSIDDSVKKQNKIKTKDNFNLTHTLDSKNPEQFSNNKNTTINHETEVVRSINPLLTNENLPKQDNKMQNESGLSTAPYISCDKRIQGIDAIKENGKKVTNKVITQMHVGESSNMNTNKVLEKPNIENTHEKNAVLNTNMNRNISIHTPLRISSLLNPIYLPKKQITDENLLGAVNNTRIPTVNDPVKSSESKVVNVIELSKPDASNNCSSTNRCRLDPEIVSQIIKKSMEEKEKRKQEKDCKKEIKSSVVSDHTERRELINQLELSIAKGDEKAAADAAVKLAKLRLACSVLSFSSQIVAGPSTSKTHLNHENIGNFDTALSKIECQENNVLNKDPSNVQNNGNTSRTNQEYDNKREKDKNVLVVEKVNHTIMNDNILIEIWIEDKVAARGPVQLNISRHATIAELRQEAEKTFGLAVRLQRWIIGKTLCTDDTVSLVSLAGSNFTAPFYLCLVESDENKTEPKSNLESDKQIQSSELAEESHASGEFYTELIKLEQQALVSNNENFECGVCMEDCAIGNGAVLRECIHTFCRECLSDAVRHCEDPVVPCPAIGCPGVLQDREIRALLSEADYDKWLARSLAVAESGTRNTFHCRTTDCSGWAFCEPGVRRFPCPVCKHTNCVPCQAVHEGLTCEEYQRKLREAVTAAENNNTDEGTQALLNSLISRGEALECPECQAIITKKWGCDWVKCSACKTEICWITKGRRWGPAGRGDTSGGCRCGIDGKRCHPSCGYCH